jgi:hypothetical protein
MFFGVRKYGVDIGLNKMLHGSLCLNGEIAQILFTVSEML